MPLLGVPLDAHAGNRLSRLSAGELGPWPALKGVNPETNRKFQDLASRLATEKGYSVRVLLDDELFLP